MNRREFLATTAAGSVLPATAQKTQSGAGYAERDISPDLGMEQPGGYGKSYHTHFHDPCKVRAAVFGDGASRVALVGIDAGSVPRNLVTDARDEITRKCGIAADAVMVVASHSHSGGPVGGVQPGEYDRASGIARKLAYEHTTMDNPVYTRRVRDGIVGAVLAADANRAALVCGVGTGHEDGVAFNRRFRMKNGDTWTHPGKGNPDVIGPAGPTDPEVRVIGSWDPSGKLRGCVVNFCCHATTNPGGISANWIYYLEQAVRGAFGHGVVVVFLQGTAGDVTQVDNLSAYRRASGDAEARLVGGCVGAEVIRALLSMPRGVLTPVRSASKVVRIPRRAPSKEHVQRALELVRKDPKQVGVTEWTFAKETVLLDAKLRREPVADVEMQAIQIGPAVLLANPAELFCAYGLEMKRRSRFPFTWPIAYANGNAGYVPTEEALGPGGGGYETRLTSYSNLVPSAGTQITNTCVQLAAAFTPGAVPEPPPAPAFGAGESGIGPRPWSYGNVPPELS